MQAEQTQLETNNAELINAYQEKSRAQQQLQRVYQALKAQVMATRVANAAGNEVDNALQSARGDRFVDKLPGARAGVASLDRKSVV